MRIEAYYSTPSKLVVYKPMGAERAADRAVLYHFTGVHDVTITLRCVVV